MKFHILGNDWRGLGLAFVLGLLGAFSSAPLYVWPVWLFILPAFIWLIDQVTVPRAFTLGWLFGFGYFVCSLYWIGIAFLVDAESYAWALPIAVTGLPAYLAIYWGGAVALARGLWRPGAGRVLVLASALSLAEYLRGSLLTGFPWASPGYAAFGVEEIAQLASLFGLWGLTFLVLVAACLLVFVMERHWGSTLVLVALISTIWMFGHIRLGQAIPDNPEVRLRIIQPNIDQSDKWRSENADTIFSKLLSLSAARSEVAPNGLKDVTYLLWPESSVPFLMDEQEGALAAVARLLPDGSTLLMGSLRREPNGQPGIADDRVFNSLLAITDNGEVAATYDKFHLVPWGEYLPFEDWLAPLGLRRLVTLPGSFVSGEGPKTISLPQSPSFSPLICYEVIFPGSVAARAARPQFLLNITNDGWFGRSAGPYQHLDQARMRAIEEGLPLIRSANTGISAVIDARGAVRSHSRLGTEAVMDAALPGKLQPTLFVRLGDLPFLFMALGVILWAGVGNKLNLRLIMARNTTKYMS